MSPATGIDARTLAELLLAWPVARLALSRPGRPPWTVPIVFAPAEARLWSPLDGKPKRPGRLARAAHIDREREASLLLDHYSARWDELWWVRLEVAATVCHLSDPDPERHPGARALLAKYPQYAATALFTGEPTLIEMEIRAVSAWAPAGFT